MYELCEKCIVIIIKLHLRMTLQQEVSLNRVHCRNFLDIGASLKHRVARAHTSD